jgi:hypothetical protein
MTESIDLAQVTRYFGRFRDARFATLYYTRRGERFVRLNKALQIASALLTCGAVWAALRDFPSIVTAASALGAAVAAVVPHISWGRKAEECVQAEAVFSIMATCYRRILEASVRGAESDAAIHGMARAAETIASQAEMLGEEGHHLPTASRCYEEVDREYPPESLWTAF